MAKPASVVLNSIQSTTQSAAALETATATSQAKPLDTATPPSQETGSISPSITSAKPLTKVQTYVLDIKVNWVGPHAFLTVVMGAPYTLPQNACWFIELEIYSCEKEDAIYSDSLNERTTVKIVKEHELLWHHNQPYEMNSVVPNCKIPFSDNLKTLAVSLSPQNNSRLYYHKPVLNHANYLFVQEDEHFLLEITLDKGSLIDPLLWQPTIYLSNGAWCEDITQVQYSIINSSYNLTIYNPSDFKMYVADSVEPSQNGKEQAEAQTVLASPNFIKETPNLTLSCQLLNKLKATSSVIVAEYESICKKLSTSHQTLTNVTNALAEAFNKESATPEMAKRVKEMRNLYQETKKLYDEVNQKMITISSDVSNAEMNFLKDKAHWLKKENAFISVVGNYIESLTKEIPHTLASPMAITAGSKDSKFELDKISGGSAGMPALIPQYNAAITTPTSGSGSGSSTKAPSPDEEAIPKKKA